MQSFRLLGICLAGTLLAACEEQNTAVPQPQHVRAVAATRAQYQPGAEITGEVKARIQTELSFRVSGRVIERRADVGSRVRAGEILARLNDTEQQADVSVARAALESAKAVARQKTLAFERAQNLLRSQVIAQQVFDAAKKELLSAHAALETAEAALATAQDAVSYTIVKADADGIITARGLEVGQVVSAAQSVFTLAHDGPRDAVFDVFEAFFLDGRPSEDVAVSPLTDQTREVRANIREMSPVIDTGAGTIRIKATLPADAGWPLGTALVGRIQSSPRLGILLPYNAIASDHGDPAVWLIDTAKHTVTLRRISVDRYRKIDFVVADGIDPYDLVVTEGGKFLREGQAVAWEGK
jgi:RND family efflux transporter MFP subunit